MRLFIAGLLTALLFRSALPAVAQGRASLPPVRSVGALLGVVIDSSRSPFNVVRPLRGGQLLVADHDHHRVALYDGVTQRFTTLPVPNDRLASAFGLISYRGDSAVLITTAPPVTAFVIN